MSDNIQIQNEIGITEKAIKQVARIKEVNSIPQEFVLRIIIVDGKSLFYITGTVLDFCDGFNKRGFVFNYPNAVKTCECRISFRV